MRITRNTPDTLILRGQHWLVFALVMLVVLLTPLWFWIAYHIGDWRVWVAAVVAPVALGIGYVQEFRNWQLVFEAEYGICTLYSGSWLSRQRAQTFPLETIKRGIERIETIPNHDSFFHKRDRQIHHFGLELTNSSYARIIGRGGRSNVSRVIYGVNHWLSDLRARERTAKAKATEPLPDRAYENRAT